MGETKLMIAVICGGLVAVAIACFFIFRRADAQDSMASRVAAVSTTSQRLPSTNKTASASVASTTSPVTRTAPSVASAPKRDETPQEMLDRFTTFTNETLLPAITKYEARMDAQMDQLAQETRTTSKVEHELLNTDVKRTDSAVNPLVAVATLKKQWEIQSKDSALGAHGSQTITLTFAPDSAGGWRPLRCVVRMGASFRTEGGKLVQRPGGEEREDSVTWVKDALAGKGPPPPPAAK